MPDIIAAYTGPYSDWPDHWLTFFPDKYTPGGHVGGVNCPLGEMLRQQCSTDAHFAMYHGDGEIRATKGGDNGPLNFDIAAFDLDFGGHQRRPNADDFAKLVRILFLIDEMPNIVYQTRGGARIIYAIDRLTDPDEFERHYQSLLKRLTPLFQRNGHGYEVDEQAKDWTRLFRCPHVTRDGNPEFHYHIRQYHDNKLDLCSFKSIRKRKPKLTATNRDYDCRDPYIWNRLNDLAEGNRNSTVFAAAAWALTKYAPAAAEQWLDVIAAKASEAGLDDREIESILNSARKKAA